MQRISARLWGLAALSGVLQVMPFPIAGPVPAWRTAFSWIALLPLLTVLVGNDRDGRPVNARSGAALGFISGLIWYLGSCYWIFPTMHLYGGIARPAAAGILLLFCLYLGLYHALFGAVVAGFSRLMSSRKSRFRREATLTFVPFAWVAVELARARITGFPWDLLGVSQVDNPLLRLLAPITGAYGLSFVVAGINALWLMPITLRDRRHTRTALTGSGVVLILLYVAFARHATRVVHEGGTATATLVQENLEVGAEATGPQLSKAEMLRSFAQLSLFPPVAAGCNGIPELASTRCTGYSITGESRQNQLLTPTDLIIWPESPAPFQEDDQQVRDALSAVARAADSPVIAGDISIERDPGKPQGVLLHNSAEFYAPSGALVGRYDKMHLVPFGEYVPFRRLFFFAGSLLEDVGEFSPGLHRSLFAIDGHRVGTFICYESIFGDEVREYADLGADVLVNISDDGWYGDTSAPWQHLNMVRMRAIENHRWVLRATNSGVTAAIDPEGRVVEAAPRHIRTSLHVGFDYEHDRTFYVRHGDWFAWLCAVITAGALGLMAYERITPPNAVPSRSDKSVEV